MNSPMETLKTSESKSGSKLLNHLKQYAKYYLMFAGMQLAILLYYWSEWHTFANFVLAIDHHSKFMQDFISHYYPMGKEILTAPIPVSGYYYTSFFALLLAPFGMLKLSPALVIWGAIQFTCLAAFCVVCARSFLKLPPFWVTSFIGVCTTSFPILHNLKWGQVSILITLCILTAFLLSNQKKHVLPGILLAFATAIKLYPALFILHFILKRDLRTCVSFLLALFIFYFAFPATILGFNNWFAFENATSAAISNANWITNDANSQFIAHVGLRWFSIFFNHAGGFSLASILTVIGYAITISCIGMMWAFQKNALYEKQGLPLVAIFLVIPFVLKTSWPHYFVYLPFCQAAVLSYSITTFGVAGWHRRALIILPIFSILFSSVFFFNLFPDWIVYNSYGMLFFANAFLLIAMYGITIMTHLEQHTWN